MLVPTSKTYICDRTGAETDDKCGMKFWLNRKEGPHKIGIVPVEEAFDLLIGRETHEDLATIAEMDDLRPTIIQRTIDDILSSITREDWADQRKMERVFRRVGWLAAFALYIEPRIRQQFENIKVEGEVVLDRSPLWVPITPDRVLKHRKEGWLTYREWKTVRYPSKSWMDHWTYDIQMHIGLAAIEEELKQPVKFGQVQGLLKGHETDSRLYHPYVWGYYNGTTNEWTESYDKARGANWDPRPVWEYPGGVVDWVERCGDGVALTQFPMSAPVFLNKKMLDDWVLRRTAREQEIAIVEDLCREDQKQRLVYFPQRTQHCKPSFGAPCGYLKCCWLATTNADPARDPEFIVREPHHEFEKIYNSLGE